MNLIGFILSSSDGLTATDWLLIFIIALLIVILLRVGDKFNTSKRNTERIAVLEAQQQKMNDDISRLPKEVDRSIMHYFTDLKERIDRMEQRNEESTTRLENRIDGIHEGK